MTQIIASVLILAVIVLWIWLVQEMSKTVTKLTSQIQHLYQLCDLVLLWADPALRMFYIKLRQSGPITSADQANKMAQEMTAEMYRGFKNNLGNAIEKETDPAKRERLQSTIKEFDDIFSLYSTVGPDSSQEYIETIGRNISEIRIRVSKMLSDLQD